MKFLARFIGAAIQGVGVVSCALLTLGMVIWCIAYADSESGIIGGFVGFFLCPIAAIVLPIHCLIHEGAWVPAALVFLGIPTCYLISGIGGAIRESGKSN
jgi:uncharacterized membrane protein